LGGQHLDFRRPSWFFKLAYKSWRISDARKKVPQIDALTKLQNRAEVFNRFNSAITNALFWEGFKNTLLGI
jgi:predicted signal transduction protein with EAL and GGDEF domain